MTNTQTARLENWIETCRDIHDQICLVCVRLAKAQAALSSDETAKPERTRLANAYLALSRARVELVDGANHLFALQDRIKQHTAEAVAQ
jgi:hypothetical protein